MTQQEFEQRYRRIRSIGTGGFSEVYQAYDKYTGRYVAIKKAAVKPEWNGFELMREYEITKNLSQHDHVAQYYSCHRFNLGDMAGQVDCAVLKYYEHGNLEQFLQKNTLTELQMEQLVRGLVEGLLFLHRNQIIHRDFKAQNILIDREDGVWVPKITDFGLSREFDQYASMGNSAIAVSYAYAAPEQLQSKDIRPNVDLWAMGVVIYRIVASELPFKSHSMTTEKRSVANMEVSRKIIAGELPNKLKELPQPYRQMVEQCLVVNQQERIQNAEDLLKILDSHQFVEEHGAFLGGASEPLKGHSSVDSERSRPKQGIRPPISPEDPTIQYHVEEVESETEFLKKPQAVRNKFQEPTMQRPTAPLFGAFLRERPTQQTLWYWTYVPVIVLVLGWTTFGVGKMLNGATSSSVPEYVNETVKPPLLIPVPGAPSGSGMSKQDSLLALAVTTLRRLESENKRALEDKRKAEKKAEKLEAEAKRKIAQQRDSLNVQN